jgi:16S rRNA processing protein RimM
LEEFWPHQGRIVLKFAGIDSIADAETLVGCEIQIPQAERAELEPGANYVGDLLGCLVVVSEAGQARELGRIEDVDFSAGEAPLLTVRAGNKEYLLPFASAYVKSLDATAKRLEMALPEGMLDLDAPLTNEEKQQAKRGN